MTAVLVWSEPNHGPQFIATIPEDPKALPITYSDRATASATVALASKGKKVPWPEYARSLTTGLPYFGWWDIAELPDGYGLRDGLYWLRQSTGILGDPPPMNADVKLPGETPDK